MVKGNRSTICFRRFFFIIFQSNRNETLQLVDRPLVRYSTRDFLRLWLLQMKHKFHKLPMFRKQIVLTMKIANTNPFTIDFQMKLKQRKKINDGIETDWCERAETKSSMIVQFEWQEKKWNRKNDWESDKNKNSNCNWHCRFLCENNTVIFTVVSPINFFFHFVFAVPCAVTAMRPSLFLSFSSDFTELE